MKRWMLFALVALLSFGTQTIAWSESPVMTLTDPEPVWHQCENAGDCTLIQGFCRYPEAVSYKYRDEYLGWLRNSPPAACALLSPPKSVCVKCRESRCFAEVKR